MIVGRILTFCYFAYFLILLPLLTRIEKPRPVPNSIADDVLAKSGGKAAPMVSTVIALLVAGGAVRRRRQAPALPKGHESRRRRNGRSPARSASSIAAHCSAA